MNYYKMSNGAKEAIVPEDKVYEAVYSTGVIFAKKEEYEAKGRKVFDDYYAAHEFYDVTLAPHCRRSDRLPEGASPWYPEGEPIIRPYEGEWICVFDEAGEGVGEDPYEWLYNLYCYFWRNEPFCCEQENADELQLIKWAKVGHQRINCGREERYFIFRNESGEYIIGYENVGYPDPISEIEKHPFSSLEEAGKRINAIGEGEDSRVIWVEEKRSNARRRQNKRNNKEHLSGKHTC
jgi:hypothetical protein